MKYDVTKGGYILLGRCGENLARTVEIDVSEYLVEYPGAVVTLLHRRHGESGIYPVAAELRDGCLVWQPTSADTAIAGSGEAEVRVTVNGVLAKSKILSTMVDKSLTGQETDAPQPGMDWVDKITTAIGSVKNMKAEAESVAYGEPATAEYDGTTGTMHFGIPEGRPGRDGTDGKDGAAGAKGDKGDPGSDANVTAANIETALGYVPVTPSALATKQNTLTDADRQSITKTGMISGAAWTTAEQKAARERMGIPGDYELIEEITISEAIESFIRESTPDGTPYSLDGFFCVITSPGVDNAITLNQNIFAGGTSLYNYGVRAIDKSVNAKSVLFACVNNKILHAEQYPVGVNYEFANVTRFAKKFVPDGSPITKVQFNGDIPVNTKITIYGVIA